MATKYKNELTIIIPTHNNIQREYYIKRVMEYFSTLPFEVIVCDSSMEQYDQTLIPKVIKYLHVPNLSFAEKMIVAIEHSKSKYIACCGDDDFLLLNGLKQAVSTLNENIQVSVVYGKQCTYSFNPNYSHVNFMVNVSENDGCLARGVAEQRVRAFFSDYQQILWSVFKKETLLKAYKAVNDAKFKNDNFIELCIGTIFAEHGCIVECEEVFNVRRFNDVDNWGSRHSTIDGRKKSSNDYEDFLAFDQVLAPIVGNHILKVAFDTYVVKCRRSFISKIKAKLFRARKKLTVIDSNKIPRAVRSLIKEEMKGLQLKK